MDIYKAIHDLVQEKKRLDAIIASLETRSDTGLRTKSKRGRKSMSQEERAEVSRRMAAYWAARRGQAAAAATKPEAPPEAPPEPAETALPPAEMPPAAHLARAAASGFEATLS